MKFKFTKLAALLLAGAALLASGCTDYEVDIQKANQRIDQLNTELNNQVDALKNLLQTTYETIANHDADVQKLEKADRDLKDLIDALDSKKLDKSEYQKLVDAIAAAKAKLAALDYANEDFVNQVADLLVKMDAAIKANAHDINEITKEGGLLDQYLAQAKAYTDAEIKVLEKRVKKNEDDIKELNDVIIPAIKDRLDALEALTDGGEEGWKDADGKSVTIKEYIDANVAVITAAIEKLQALTAGFPEGKTIKEYVDEADHLLETQLFSVIAKAFGTKDKMEAMQGTLLGRIEALEELTAGFPAGTTIKKYIDDEVKKLQDQVDALDARVDVIDDALAFCKKVNDDGTYSYDLKGEFDKVNKRIDDVIEWATELFSDIYDKLYSALSRIQSIQYVPDYDDLKITTNVALFSQPGMVETEDGVVLIDQPTKMTYQFLPAQYASAIAAEIKKNIIAYGDNPWTYDQLKNSNFTDKLIAYFNVKPVNTRAEEAPETLPEFQIIGIDKVDDTTGEITFVVQPKNVATATYLANGLKPRYDLDLYFEYTYWDCGLEVWGNQIYYFGGQYVSDGDWVVAAKWDDDANDFVDQWPVYGQDPNNPQYRATTIPIWNYQDLMKFQARTNYAAQLVLYKKDAIVEDDPESIVFSGTDYENHLASPYNVLYPHTFDMVIPEDPYKKLDDGSVRLFTEDEQHQKLSYNTLRGVSVGTDPAHDPVPYDYRIILDQAVPAVIVDGKGPMTIEAAVKAGYNVPAFKTTFEEFTYDKGTAAEVNEENFIATPKVYAELEMNPERSAALRKLAIGNVITGSYAFTSALGSFGAAGDVTITKEQGSIDVAAEIKWLYKYDADVDHGLYYGATPAPQYSRSAVEITPDAEQYAALGEKLGITLEDFKKATPKSVKITNEAGEEVTDLVISQVTIDGNKLTADFAGYEWGKTYTVVAVYELAYAEITVNGTLTTIDRNREIIDITLPDYAIALNGADYDAANDTYTTQPADGDFLEALYKKFIANEIINQVASAPDFADAEAFKGDGSDGIGGKEGHLTRYYEEGGALPAGESPYVICGDDYAIFFQVKSEELYKVWKAGKAQVRNVTTYIGQRVRITWNVTVALPDYDFLHLTYYTFNTKEAVDGFQQKRTYYKYDEADPVVWWTQVNPSYFTGEFNAQQEKISFRHALKQYDVAYINLAELAFNVVDEKDQPIDDARIAAEKIVVDFDYATIDPQTDLPKVDQITGSYEKYVNLWVNQHPTTVFYYRTNDKPYIQAYGKLGIKSGNTVFELQTRFDRDKAPVAHPELTEFNYKDYYMVRWTPFKDGEAKGFDIVLDENKIYREPLFKNMSLEDRRPNDVSYYVIKNGEWVVGNVETFDAEAGTYQTNGNGYIKGVAANTAYDIKTTFTYDDLELPVELRKLLSVKYYDAATNSYLDKQNEAETLVPYIVYDYTSEVQFQGVVTIPVAVKLENPWQETITFDYKINIKGYND